jgi:hypothetical protein
MTSLKGNREPMKLFSYLRGRKNTFTGTARHTTQVMTASSYGTAFFGVHFREQKAWVRIYTNDISLAESITFQPPDEVVSIDFQESIKEGQQTWHRLLRAKPENNDGDRPAPTTKGTCWDVSSERDVIRLAFIIRRRRYSRHKSKFLRAHQNTS